MAQITTGRLLARVVRAAGIDAVYGRPLAGVPGVVVDEQVAHTLAAAHLRVHGRRAAVHLASGVLEVGAGVGARPGTPPTEIVDADDLLAAVPVLAAGAASLHLALDLAEPTADVTPPRPAPADRWVAPDAGVVDVLRAARRPVVLAGPGVVSEAGVPGLHALAAAASLGVLNTWGAKGVFDWRSRHHLATAGLQRDDFALAGLGDADLIVATGVDPAEAPDALWRDLAPVVHVPPGALDPLAGPCGRPPTDVPMPPLRTELARVTQEGWASTASPLAPTLVTRHYGQAIGGGGLVAADPGVAGYWVARTFATTDLGGVQVPADRDVAGFAAACALVARLRAPFRPVLAVVDAGTAGLADGLVDGATATVLAAAGELGVSIPLAVWDPGGPALDADDHLARVRSAVVTDAPEPVVLATDPAQLGRMVEAAGEVVAWGGIAGGV